MRWNDLIGLRVGQYQVIEELGRGGAARVFRALDEPSARPVAFKVLPIETDDRAAFMQRFEREAKVIRTLSHPNIVQVYDAGETDEFVYLVLRLLSGGTLRQRIARQRMSTQEVCRYMIQIARALHHAHQQGIIHRDVKPSNMLLDQEESGHILLTDFGTAKILNARGLTKTGATVGTPEYMSPEQAEGHEVDQRSDIYSLGCSLYEALAGRPPFVGVNPVSVLYQQVHVQPTYIRSYNAEAPRELWDVLRACLSKRPEDRPGSAERVAEELQPFAEGLIQPTPAPWSSPLPARPTNSELGRRRLRAEAPDATPAPNVPILPLHPTNAPGPIPLYLEGSPAPNSRPTLGPRGPKPTLRLPVTSGGTGLLSGPLGPQARQAISAFEAQIDADERLAPAPTTTPRPARQTGRLMNGQPMNGFPMTPAPTTVQRARASGPMRSPQSGSFGAPYGETFVPPQYMPPLPPQYAAPSRPRPASPSTPDDINQLRAGINPDTLGRRSRPAIRRRPPLLMGGVVAAALALTVALGMSGIGLLAKQRTPTTHAHATPKPTMKVAHPTATAAQPTATPTPTAQQLLDKQAAASFRAITLSSFGDGACSSAASATHFAGTPVFVNLCMGGAKAPGSVTVVVRRGGSIVRTLISNLNPAAGVSYSQGHTLGSGSYDMLVTMRINGQQAVAEDIAFTVA